VKICGVTQHEQALEIAKLGADYIGINFWPHSKRYLAPEKAAKWMRKVPSPTRLVGVFVNPEASYVKEIASTGLLSHVQLHGDESPEFCASLAADGMRVLKAFQVRDESSLVGIEAYDVSDILLDAYTPLARGGTGETFPWELAVEFKQRFPKKSLWLAGGLIPENIAEAVKGVQPYAVDVASGVENGTPGVKVMDKVVRFIREAKRPGESDDSVIGRGRGIVIGE
jgi:phosphoribosylanthranilate isomerase